MGVTFVQIMPLLKQLARDETGGINSAELVMIVTLLAIGLLVGMKAFRDSAVTEFADMAQALANLNQSYSVSAFTVDLGAGGILTTASSIFIDAPDFCDTSADTDVGTSGSKCVNVCIAASTEAE